MSVSAENKNKIAGTIKNLLTERFHDEFVFDPVVVRHEIDHDGDEYLEIYVVYDGDQKNLDAGWIVRLSGHIWPESIAVGVPSVPGISFVEKSEWEELFAGKYGES